MSDESLIVFELSPVEKAYLARLDGRRKSPDAMARDIVRLYIITESRKESAARKRSERKAAARQPRADKVQA